MIISSTNRIDMLYYKTSISIEQRKYSQSKPTDR